MARPPWLRVKYRHDSADLSGIYLAVSNSKPGNESMLWQTAFRDTYKDQRVLQIRHRPLKHSERVWLWDRDGPREAEIFEH